MRTIRICAPDIFEGDAVGNHCHGIFRMLVRNGFNPTMYANNYDSNSIDIFPVKELFEEIHADDLLILSYSIYDPYFENFIKLQCTKICYFHGVTSPDLLREFDPQTAELCRKSFEQIKKFSTFNKLIVNSLYTKESLVKHVDELKIDIIPPVFMDMSVFNQKIVARKMPNDLELLMVGRVVPHKNIELGVEVVKELQSSGKNIRLTIVGGIANYEYFKYLINLGNRLDVLDNIIFLGAIHEDGLFDIFRRSNLLLSTSKHEGFCVPVLEALYFGLTPLVLKGSAAEQICPSEFSILSTSEPSQWVKKINQYNGFSEQLLISLKLKNREKYLSVMKKCSDEVWLKALNV